MSALDLNPGEMAPTIEVQHERVLYALDRYLSCIPRLQRHNYKSYKWHVDELNEIFLYQNKGLEPHDPTVPIEKADPKKSRLVVPAPHIARQFRHPTDASHNCEEVYFEPTKLDFIFTGLVAKEFDYINDAVEEREGTISGIYYQGFDLRETCQPGLQRFSYVPFIPGVEIQFNPTGIDNSLN